jgi:hypothetical protein
MTVAAVAMMRNEEDVVEYVVRHMLAECDLVIVADNNSTDRTRDILEVMATPDLQDPVGSGRLIIVDEPRVAYLQQETTLRLVSLAVERGASWVLAFDADEMWFCPSGQRIADVLAAHTGRSVPVGSWEMVPQRSDDPNEVDPFKRIVWRRRYSNQQKVVWRPSAWNVPMVGNHALEGEPRYTKVVGAASFEGQPIVLRHYPYRTFEQTRAKVRHGRMAIEATPYAEGVGFHWRELGAMDDGALARWWAEWTAPKDLVKA